MNVEIIETIRREAGKQDISESSRIEDLEMDSLELLSLILEIEKVSGQKFDMDSLTDVQTIGELICRFAPQAA